MSTAASDDSSGSRSSDQDASKPEAPKRDRSLMIVLSIIGALVLIALIVVFTRGEPQDLDASTPEGVVQRYSAAAISGDEAEAAMYLTESALERCDDFGGEPPTDGIRVRLVSTTERHSTADVKVSIVTSFESGPFGPSEYEVDEVFDLTKVDGEWLIDSAPWQLMACPGSEVR
ncbi:hypothetical protein [Ruicaihuangia caeni]|uniref:Lipoprotein LpqB N-terminal domain-containing protein n=1 Tax=Ruicaihuangia caeni TaxID=3042517 RepID=A0AAW6TCM0_9MICO|nr:hypothetical protein [Klugiella sp. YN-L-19]MDI2099573.1 hypothetical protein [Klugiella sp. YN-L-19]